MGGLSTIVSDSLNRALDGTILSGCISSGHFGKLGEFVETLVTYGEIEI